MTNITIKGFCYGVIGAKDEIDIICQHQIIDSYLNIQHESQQSKLLSKFFFMLSCSSQDENCVYNSNYVKNQILQANVLVVAIRVLL